MEMNVGQVLACLLLIGLACVALVVQSQHKNLSQTHRKWIFIGISVMGVPPILVFMIKAVFG